MFSHLYLVNQKLFYVLSNFLSCIQIRRDPISDKGDLSPTHWFQFADDAAVMSSQEPLLFLV